MSHVGGVVVRRIRPDDALAVRDIRLRALASDPLAFGSTFAAEVLRSEAVWIERAERQAAGSDRTMLLALRDDVIVGVIRADRDTDREDVFGVYGVWVAPEERRAGIGARLLTAIEKWILGSGGRMAQLFVSDQAPSARRLYERAGYLPDGRTEPSPHAGVTEHGMSKALAVAQGHVPTS